MMKKALVLISMVGLGFLLAWAVSEDTSQLKAELESLKAELGPLKTALEKTESDRDTLKVKIALDERNQEQLQEQVNELTDSRDKLQKQIEEFSFSRDQSQQQLAEIVRTRDNLKNQLAELTDSQGKLQQQLTELTTSRNQLLRQIDELTRSRDAAVTKAETAQERVDILLALVDAETKQFRELQDQDELTVTSQAEEDTLPPILEVGEDPNVLAEISWPPVAGGHPGERPTCQSFNTTRPQILPGQTSTLSWQVSNAESIRIEPGIGPVSALGSRVVIPSSATTYTLIAANKAGESRKTCRVEIGDSPAIQNQVSEQPTVLTELIEPVIVSRKAGERPNCQSFNATRPQIMPGQTSTLSWQVSNAQSIRIEPNIGRISALGSRVVRPSTTTTYTLVATNKEGESQKTCRIDVGEQPAIQSRITEHPTVLNKASEPPAVKNEVIEPVIVSDKADERPTCHSLNTTRPRIMPGQTSTLSWQVSNAKSVRIEPGIGPVSALGSRVVNPSTTTMYTLIAANDAGQSRISCRIEISDRSAIISSDAIHPRILLERDTTSGDHKVRDSNTTLGKFLGYRARRDESGKLIFIPVYENKQEE